MRRYLLLLFALVFMACQDDPEPAVQPLPAADQHEQSVFSIPQQPSSGAERERLAKNLGAADFVPLGLMVRPGESITVDVQIPSGSAAPVLLMGTYSRNEWTYTPYEFGLSTSGPRSLTNPASESLLLYIRYTGTDPDKIAEITVEGGYRVPFFQPGRTTNEDFRDQLEQYEQYTDVQLLSEKGMIVLGRNIALKYRQQDWEQLMLTLDQVVATEEFISGLDGSSPLHAPSGNRYFLTQTRDSRYWMAATNYRTFYNAIDAIDFVADRFKLERDGWGPWHEIGHQHQLSAITWNETVEVTVNIYSLAVERAFGLEPRLKRENRWPAIMEYLARPASEKDYNDPSLGPFLRLGLFQQLWLAYGDDFYIRLHQKIRQENPDISLKTEKMAYLMLKASEAAGEDLSDFFRAWGFRLDDQAYASLDQLGLPQPSVNLSELTD